MQCAAYMLQTQHCSQLLLGSEVLADDYNGRSLKKTAHCQVNRAAAVALLS